MSTEHSFNKEKVIKVSIHLTEVSDDYYYHPGSKFLGFTLKKRGVYSYLWKRYQGEFAPKYHTLIWNDKSGTVYLNPHVVVHFPDKHKLIERFESDSEARKYAHDNWLKGGPFISNS